MITIKREGTIVVVEVGSQWPLNEIYLFYWQANREDFAKLLADNLRENLNGQIRRIRQEEYNRGWKDAKSKKRPKETWFTCLWK